MAYNECMEPLFRSPPPPYSPYAPARARPSRSAPAGRNERGQNDLSPTERLAEIERIGRQLGKVAQTLTWGRVQNDAWDRLCPFIFDLRSAEAVVARIEKVSQAHPEVDSAELARYALRRWYCFWGARLAELLFLCHPNVRPGPPKDHEIDFSIDGVPFDLKTSDLPRVFLGGLPEMLGDPSRAISWFYAHQSRERRFHVANRLFLVLSDPRVPAETWRLRGDVAALRTAIDRFLESPRYVELSVADERGQAHPVRSAIIPVQPIPAPRQLPLALPPTPASRFPRRSEASDGQMELLL